MLTYSNDPEAKAEFVAEVKRHSDLDHLIRGTYGEGLGDHWRGCAVGCAAVSWAKVRGVAISPDDHAALEREGLYPEWLARLEDTLFERLPYDIAMQWPLRLSTAIPVGVDLDPVKWRFYAFLMQENIDRVLGLDIPEQLKTKVVDAIRDVLTVYETAVATGEWNESAAESAESAAWSAARSAESAWSAAWSAARSAESAWSAARFAARFAAESAESAESAARSAAYERYADKLIELLEAATRQEVAS